MAPPFYIIMSLSSATTSIMCANTSKEITLLLHKFSVFKTSNTFLSTGEESTFMTLGMLLFYKSTVCFDNNQIIWLSSHIWLRLEDRFTYSL